MWSLLPIVLSCTCVKLNHWKSCHSTVSGCQWARFTWVRSSMFSTLIFSLAFHVILFYGTMHLVLFSKHLWLSCILLTIFWMVSRIVVFTKLLFEFWPQRTAIQNICNIRWLCVNQYIRALLKVVVTSSYKKGAKWCTDW